jgi:predicted type IV restriction endonuclease
MSAGEKQQLYLFAIQFDIWNANHARPEESYVVGSNSSRYQRSVMQTKV